jgi:hypothetical protein
MEIEIALLISGITMAFGIYSGMNSIRRHTKADSRKDGAEMTMVIVKLEGISEGIAEIKTDLSHVKGDIKEITERLIIAEQSIKLAHTRLDEVQNTKGK